MILADSPPASGGRKSPASSLTNFQKVLAALFVLMPVAPHLLLSSAPTVLYPIDPTVRWATVGLGVLLSQSIFWGLLTAGAWQPGHVPAKIAIGMLSMLFSAMYALTFGFMAMPAVGLYELGHLEHSRRDKLYVIELVSAAGRGGPHAYIDPYGSGRLGLPLSQVDYLAFVGGRYTWQGLVCYRGVELRRGDIVGIEKPSERQTPSGVLAKCRAGDPNVVLRDTKYSANRTGKSRE